MCLTWVRTVFSDIPSSEATWQEPYPLPTMHSTSFLRTVVEFTRSYACHLILEPWRGAFVPQADDATAASQLLCAQEELAAAGFAEYAPLCFSRPGEEDPAILAKSSGMDVLGFGLGATTRFDGVTSQNTDDWDTYLAYSGDFTRITASVETAESAGHPEEAPA